MKALPALIFAFAITAIIGIVMFVVGGNALLNTNSVPLLNSPPASGASNAAASIPSSDLKLAAAEHRIADMQNLINQYQTRENQYQTELQQAAQKVNDANAQLAQANQQVQVFQQVLAALQQRGIIRITQNGEIQLLQGGNGF